VASGAGYPLMCHTISSAIITLQHLYIIYEAATAQDPWEPQMIWILDMPSYEMSIVIFN